MIDKQRGATPAGQDWQAGKTFFEESGGEPAIPAGGGDRATDAPESTGKADGEPQSWPGKSFGSIPPPG